MALDYEEPYPKRKKSKLWLILLLVIGIPVGLILFVVTAGILFYATAKDLPLTDADREVVTTARYLADWMEDLDPSIGTESYTKKRYLDGSVEVDYTYEHPESDPNSVLYVSCTVTVDKKVSDARITYGAGAAGTSIGLGISGVTREERNDLFSWGEKSKCALLHSEDGSKVGNTFRCLTGRKTFEWTVIGLYFAESEPLAEVLEPVLSRLEAYHP